MQKPETDNIIRDQLKAKRRLLFKEFCKNPQNTSLAIEIRLIDDQVADLAAYRNCVRKSKPTAKSFATG
jgi:hypothetical protein